MKAAAAAFLITSITNLYGDPSCLHQGSHPSCPPWTPFALTSDSMEKEKKEASILQNNPGPFYATTENNHFWLLACSKLKSQSQSLAASLLFDE